MAEPSRCLAVVRIRGMGEGSPDVKRTLDMLHLTRNCHITLVNDRPSVQGMLRKAKDFVTWGEATRATILALLSKRGRLAGDKKIDDAYAQAVGYKTLGELADALHRVDADLQRLPGIKPVFRGHPPRKGYKGTIKKSYTAGGVTGYRGEAINALVESMI
jgi:large subunit ribosomal protein L30